MVFLNLSHYWDLFDCEARGISLSSSSDHLDRTFALFLSFFEIGKPPQFSSSFSTVGSEGSVSGYLVTKGWENKWEGAGEGGSFPSPLTGASFAAKRGEGIVEESSRMSGSAAM